MPSGKTAYSQIEQVDDPVPDRTWTPHRRENIRSVILYDFG